MKTVFNFFKNKDEINKITNSNLFLAFITFLLFLSWATDLFIISFITITFSLLLITIYNDDAKVLGALLILTMISYPVLPYFNTIPWYLIIELVLLFISFGFITFKNLKNKTNKFSLGSIGFSLIVLAIIVLLCESVRHISPFNPSSNFTSFGYIGVLFVLLMILAYFLFHLCNINNKDGYFQKVFLFINLLLIAEASFIFLTNGFQTIDFNLLKWGEKNAFALLLEICLPFIALLYGKDIKRLDYFILIIIDYFFIIISCSRGGSITALLLIPLLVYIGLNKRKDIAKLYPFYLIFAYSIIPVCYLIIPAIRNSANKMFEVGLTITGRDNIWEEALKYFENNPIFGGGISSLFDLNVTIHAPEGAIFFPHNTLVTLLSTCGILGIFSFALLLYELIVVFINYKDKEKFVYIFFILVGLLHGIIDNTFYSIVYMFPLIFIFSNNDLKGFNLKK